MSAMMKQPIIYIMTHDSIGLGEDGPTHQPIEQIPSLRIIPNLNLWRPADMIETAIAWEEAICEKKTPSILALSRQNLPHIIKKQNQIKNIRKGGYILKKSNKKAKLNLISTGSEMHIMYEVYKEITNLGISANLISMPCITKFKKNNISYKNKIINPKIPTIIMEATHPDIWYSLLQPAGGYVIGIKKFGKSASNEELYKNFNLTVEECIKKVKIILKIQIN
jgi:transketolase